MQQHHLNQTAINFDGIKENPTQEARLLDYLKSNKKITTVKAFEILGISNSATPRRIKDLEAKGYEIERNTVTHFGRYGTAHITEYTLVGNEPKVKDNQ